MLETFVEKSRSTMSFPQPSQYTGFSLAPQRFTDWLARQLDKRGVAVENLVALIIKRREGSQ
jgi:hypothetical protein